MARLLLLVCWLGLLTPVTGSARTWHVRPDGTGDAPTIQAGVDSAASGDTVLVAAGSYSENITITSVHNGMTLLSESGPDVTTIRAAAAGTVVDFIGVGRATVVQGFTLTGGTGAPNPEDPGSFHGGGVRAYYCSPSIIGNVIVDNHVEPGRGGGIQCFGSAALIRGNTLLGNSASYHGGAIHVEHGSPEIIENVMIGNSTLGGGTVTAYYSTIAIVGNTIADNEACINGGGIVVDNCDVVMEDNTLKGNYGHSIGGGAFVFACSGVVSCNTVVGNVAGGSAGLAFLGGQAPSVERNIVAGNSGSGPGGIGCDEITFPTFACNDVWGNVPTNYGGSCLDQTGLNGNFSACPSFCHVEAGDFRLCDLSPCLPGNHPDGYDCGSVGAWAEGCSCGPTSTGTTTWGSIKAMYR
jgi:hypothetical protein